MPTRPAAWRVLATALVAGLAACGGGGSGDAVPTPGAGGATPPPTPGITVLAGLLRAPGYTDGPLAVAQFTRPTDVAFDPASGVTYVADIDNGLVRRISADGVVSTLAGTPGRIGTPDGTGTAAGLYTPIAVAVGPHGDVAVAEMFNHTIRRITPAGVVTTIAGVAGVSGNANGPAATATFNSPSALAFDPAGNLYIGENGRIRKLGIDGAVSSLSLVTGSGQVSGIAVDGAGNLVVAGLVVAGSGRLRRFDTQGRALAWGPDGTAGIAIGNTGGVAITASGDVIVSDQDRHTLWRVDAAGTVSLYAGQDGQPGHSDGAAGSARFQAPRGITLASGGRILVADQSNYAVRQVDAAGVVSTLTGGVGAGQVDGSGSAARFFAPAAVARAADGSLRVLDAGNRVIRSLSLAGDTGTLAAPADAARRGLVATANGTLYQLRSDTVFANGTIEELDAQGKVVRSIPAGIPVSRFAAADDGTLIVWSGARGDVLLRVRPGGAVETWVTQLPCVNVTGMVFDANGLLNFSCIDGGVYRVDAAGVVQLRAGVVNPTTAIVRDTSAVNGVLEPAIFRNPGPLAADAQGNLYIADLVTVRRIAPNGEVRTLAGNGVLGARFGTENADLGLVRGIAWSGGAVYVTVRNAVLRIVPGD